MLIEKSRGSVLVFCHLVEVHGHNVVVLVVVLVYRINVVGVVYP